jgi:hypothetical protein
MGVTHNPDSNFAKLMREHEATHTQYGPPGRPYVFYPLPTHMYKAGRVNDGPVGIIESAVATTEAERSNYESLGFVCGGQKAALDAFDAYQKEMAHASAVRNAEDRHMSDKARAEAANAEAAAGEHIAEIPTTPIRPRR